MTKVFDIQIEPLKGASASDPHRIRIAAGETIFTRLIREQGREHDDAVLAAPQPLAFWLCDNWWRLRWETTPPNPPSTEAWRLAHDIAGVGGGYSWPRLCLWGDLDRIGLLSQADPVGVVGPVRYLTDALLYIPAADFEREVDHFLDHCIARQEGPQQDSQALRALISALRQERADPDAARWRRLEARLGCDPDQAPDELIQTLDALANNHGLEAIEEAVAAEPSEAAPQALQRALQAARATGHRCNFSELLPQLPIVQHKPAEPAWVAAEQAAQHTRRVIGMERGPISNKQLAELLGTQTKSFQSAAGREPLRYGLRLLDQGQNAPQTIALRAKWPEARRFELCRALGDALWAPADRLGPLADTNTARQQFQRAFAQSLLCPFNALLAFLKTDCPDDDDITAAARHFQVGERVVETLLVNKGLLPRSSLQGRFEAV
ncbi:MAG: hypothetical protein VBE63_20835 [Lamprobacter sp.]|uniref:hypothetical protein n=1 Tax=Lamprobacter sp. TaxID=3100796 RepID=UPI002B25A3BF|nr:hypothetical protein [Lamprobacter sp.]MEA3642365.1 hypothetical protein [Lamprobacter sp.]